MEQIHLLNHSITLLIIQNSLKFLFIQKIKLRNFIDECSNHKLKIKLTASIVSKK